jgi:hypothetical protein
MPEAVTEWVSSSRNTSEVPEVITGKPEVASFWYYSLLPGLFSGRLSLYGTLNNLYSYINALLTNSVAVDYRIFAPMLPIPYCIQEFKGLSPRREAVSAN